MTDGMQMDLLCQPVLEPLLRDQLWALVCARPGIHKEELADELAVPERTVRHVIHDMRVDPAEKRLIGACDGYHPIRTWDEFVRWRNQERARWWSLCLAWWWQTKKAIVKFDILGEDLFSICEDGIEMEIREACRGAGPAPEHRG